VFQRGAPPAAAPAPAPAPPQPKAEEEEEEEEEEIVCASSAVELQRFRDSILRDIVH
jgi:ribosomal protein L12E/L44/L45/RPP1/RPP2